MFIAGNYFKVSKATRFKTIKTYNLLLNIYVIQTKFNYGLGSNEWVLLEVAMLDTKCFRKDINV